ncbi:MAG: hypothetical protein NWQ23_02665 [Yoonia sp.]|uniref:hypothetical protein n=1 Tax=Yoonia sp. TaxID=2212373 RepID=UPI00273D6D30|nr:hypothetical protein [Yoonia sp.]MDP5084296.1 hypothetical protein [Yoonia sp.]
MIWRGLISLCLLVALTLSSFGHRTLSADAEAQAEAFILAGGNWADLCGDDGDPLASGAKCMACVIAHTCHLPEPALAALPDLSTFTLDWAQSGNLVITTADTASHFARGPPVLVI